MNNAWIHAKYEAPSAETLQAMMMSRSGGCTCLDIFIVGLIIGGILKKMWGSTSPYGVKKFPTAE